MNRNEDYSENINYTVPDFPVLTSREKLSELPTFRELIHWHKDFEFLMINEGVLDVCVNEKTLHIKAGQGIFTNSKRLHFGYSEKKQEVLFDMVIISPDIIRSSFCNGALESLTSPETSDYFIFSSSSQLWASLQLIMQINESARKYYELDIQSALCSVTAELCRICVTENNTKNDHITAIKNMITFIQLNYSEKITVNDIMKAGAVGRNSCFELFRKVMDMTPQQYVEQYRLSQSLNLLRKDISVSEVAERCGFSTQSYYTKIFRRTYGQTPGKFRSSVSDTIHGDDVVIGCERQ